MTLTFQGQIWNLLHLSQNAPIASKRNANIMIESCELTLVMTLTLNFQGQIWNLLYLSQNGPIATKRKATILIEPYALNLTMRFDHGHDLDFEFSRSNMKFTISQPKNG